MSDTLGYKLERQVDDYIEHELEEEIGLTKKDIYGRVSERSTKRWS